MSLIGILVPAILRIPHLAAFLEPWGRPVRFGGLAGRGREISAIAGWGFKPTADKARAEAERLGVPYLALEDGFLRSVDLGVSGAPPWSIVVDDAGIYYDPARPSRIERLIAEGAPHTDETERLVGLIRRYNLSKYNNAPDLDDADWRDDGRPLVIVLDQTAGDVSVTASGGDEHGFAAMLDAALAENAGARVIVRRHPDVAASRRRGYLDDAAKKRGVEIFASPVSFLSFAKRADRLYTMTSLAGLEGLLAGLAVTCFGAPFYAGWGLTDDRMPCPRRTARPSVLALVHAAYQRYPRYVDPADGRPCDAITIAERLAAQRRSMA